RLVHHCVPLRHLKAREPHPTTQLPEITGLLAIDVLDGREVVVDLLVQGSIETHLHEHKDPHRERADHHGQHCRVPQGEPGPQAQAAHPHPRSARRTKPTPRTVWSSLGSNGSSIFRRSRAMVTSITLSSGVARAVTRHTSRASISLDTTWPLWRSKYS